MEARKVAVRRKLCALEGRVKDINMHMKGITRCNNTRCQESLEAQGRKVNAMKLELNQVKDEIKKQKQILKDLENGITGTQHEKSNPVKKLQKKKHPSTKTSNAEYPYDCSDSAVGERTNFLAPEFGLIQDVIKSITPEKSGKPIGALRVSSIKRKVKETTTEVCFDLSMSADDKENIPDVKTRTYQKKSEKARVTFGYLQTDFGKKICKNKSK